MAELKASLRSALSQREFQTTDQHADTNLLNFNSCRKRKNLLNSLNTNIISLNIGKIDLVPFISPKKQPDSDLEIKLHRKSLCETISVKYFGI